MRKFLFRFGYCTPRQWAANEGHGWDDESSFEFLVLAESADAALSWGADVAEVFVAKLFEMAAWTEKVPSWKEAEFAHWIEENPETSLSDANPVQVPTVREGTMPDFSEHPWRGVISDGSR